MHPHIRTEYMYSHIFSTYMVHTRADKHVHVHTYTRADKRIYAHTYMC